MYWLTQEEAYPLLETNPLIEKTYRFNEKDLASIKKTSWDWIISLEEDPESCQFVSQLKTKKLTGAYQDTSSKLTYTQSSALWFDMGLLNRNPDGSLATANRLKQSNKKTYPQILSQILGLSNAKYPEDFEQILVLTNKDKEAARQFAKKYNINPSDAVIGINLGSGKRWLSKQPSIETVVRWIEALYKEFSCRMLLLGGPQETERNKTILKKCKAPILFAGTNHSLRNFAAFVELCSLVITTDTLALHIACALKKKIVAIFGPTQAAEIEIYGRGVKLLPPKRCSCFFRPRCEKSKHCLDEILTKNITQAVKKCGFYS